MPCARVIPSVARDLAARLISIKADSIIASLIRVVKVGLDVLKFADKVSFRCSIKRTAMRRFVEYYNQVTASSRNGSELIKVKKLKRDNQSERTAVSEQESRLPHGQSQFNISEVCAEASDDMKHFAEYIVLTGVRLGCLDIEELQKFMRQRDSLIVGEIHFYIYCWMNGFNDWISSKNSQLQKIYLSDWQTKENCFSEIVIPQQITELEYLASGVQVVEWLDEEHIAWLVKSFVTIDISMLSRNNFGYKLSLDDTKINKKLLLSTMDAVPIFAAMSPFIIIDDDDSQILRALFFDVLLHACKGVAGERAVIPINSMAAKVSERNQDGQTMAGDHWSAILIDKAKKEIIYYDPLGFSGRADGENAATCALENFDKCSNRYFDHVYELLVSIKGILKEEWQINISLVKHQKDEINCGVWVAASMAKFLVDGQLLKSVNEYNTDNVINTEKVSEFRMLCNAFLKFYNNMNIRSELPQLSWSEFRYQGIKVTSRETLADKEEADLESAKQKRKCSQMSLFSTPAVRFDLFDPIEYTTHDFREKIFDVLHDVDIKSCDKAVGRALVEYLSCIGDNSIKFDWLLQGFQEFFQLAQAAESGFNPSVLEKLQDILDEMEIVWGSLFVTEESFIKCLRHQ